MCQDLESLVSSTISEAIRSVMSDLVSASSYASLLNYSLLCSLLTLVHFMKKCGSPAVTGSFARQRF